MAETIDKAREEFFSEAQELVEGLARDLLNLDEKMRGLLHLSEQERKQRIDPDLVNDLFRGVHTLKGLAGLFGAGSMSTMSHSLEEVLDDLRLGRIDVTRRVLDVLFKAIDAYGQMLHDERNGTHVADPAVEALLTELGQISRRREHHEAARPEYELDPGLLAVLTEYEEHRLRTNIQSGMSLFRVRATFKLLTIDEELEQLKVLAKPLGEIITYLPTGEGNDAESIELEVLMASSMTCEGLASALGGPTIRVEELSRRTPTQPHALGESSLPAGPAARPSADSILAPPRPASDVEGLKPSPAAQGTSLKSVSQTVRVDIRKLDHLMNIVGELAIVRASLTRITERVRSNPQLRELGVEMHRLHRAFDRHLGQMQDGILEVRMVPIGQIFDKLGRVARQASRDAGKQVNLVITGAETEVDKLIVEELSDPLMHMVRNAIDHGIEPQPDRVRVGKPDVGTIAINAFQKGSHVLIEIEDDGRGMDPAHLVETAVKRGFVGEQEARELGPSEIFNLIFIPGFTTKASADMLAGRGVGMDIVKTNISRLGGIIDVQSEVGIGTKMTITLPITLAILSALIVHVGAQPFAVPLSSVQEALLFDASSVRLVDSREMMTLRGATLPLVRLGRLFEIDQEDRRRSFVVVVAAGTRRLGVVVDHLEGQQDIVIKPLGPSLRRVRGFAGAAQLGDQRVGLVLDAPALVEEVLAGEVGKTPLGLARGVA